MNIRSFFNQIFNYFPSQNISNSTNKILKRLNTDFFFREGSFPTEGYRVIFEESPLKARLISVGSLRKTKELSGVPIDQEGYKNNQCPFCRSDLKVLKVFQDNCRAIYSNSGQILIIPDVHYAHWFEMPIAEQQKLLDHAIELRKEF